MTVDFIIPTYDRKNALICMLSSLVAQSSNNWKASVVIDREFDTFDTDSICLHSNINYCYTGKRWNDWGHTPREIGKQRSECDYIIMTGDDNYYTPNFVAELEKTSLSSPGMIYWDMVHSHYDYTCFSCKPAFNQIDMGAFATRRDLAQQITLGTSYAADGEFVEEFKRRFPQEKIVKINKVLFVHN